MGLWVGGGFGGGGFGGEGDDDPDELSEINVTSFADVMLVLLIVFMVAAPLSTVDVPVDLPASQAAPSLRPEDPLWLSVSADGAAVTLGSTPVTLDSLVVAQDAATGGARGTVVYLRADQGCLWPIDGGAGCPAQRGLCRCGAGRAGEAGIAGFGAITMSVSHSKAWVRLCHGPGVPWLRRRFCRAWRCWWWPCHRPAKVGPGCGPGRVDTRRPQGGSRPADPAARSQQRRARCRPVLCCSSVKWWWTRRR
jgi:biopolymer transport protein ExbD